MGIEPTPSAWKAEALPLCNVRVAARPRFELRLNDPKSFVLPLHHRAKPYTSG